ncbi:MAG: PepSY domain-containing protein [Methyloligellaceae bacterium]
MSSVILSLCISGLALAAEPKSTEKSDQIAVSIGQLSQVLEERGYQHVRSTGDSRDIYKFEACKDGQRLQLDLDKQGEIQKQESLGLCVVAEGKTPAKTALKGGKSSVSREKPIKIEAPYTSVEIGDSVRIRAPFVNLDIPIR